MVSTWQLGSKYLSCQFVVIDFNFRVQHCSPLRKSDQSARYSTNGPNWLQNIRHFDEYGVKWLPGYIQGLSDGGDGPCLFKVSGLSGSVLVLSWSLGSKSNMANKKYKQQFQIIYLKILKMTFFEQWSTFPDGYQTTCTPKGLTPPPITSALEVMIHALTSI